MLVIDSAADGKAIDPCLINGYDGFGGVHSNLLWNWQQNIVTYTLNNKVIVEDMRTRC